MRDSINAVDAFIREYGLQTDVQTRLIDLVSEIGELGKEMIVATEYGKKELNVTKKIESEVGDCLFSLLALCQVLDVDAAMALDGALAKYAQRFTHKGSISSGN
ncbi:MAG: hypothetical protein FWC71_09995 [Defluviitaleaceae bacterium]|nr:hypothetical protein [Defluviitaleaceae bacterium]